MSAPSTSKALPLVGIVSTTTASNVLSSLLLGIGFLVVYVTVLAVYRLYFSPLAKIPGPKLAAVTSLYAFYYDVVEKGHFIWEIEKMHKQYGPIVRIRPDVLHVNDPDFIDQLFSGASKRRDKYKIACNGFATPGAGLGTINHDLHRTRRAALNPFFSKQTIRRLEPIVQEALSKVLDHLCQHAKTGSPVRMNILYSALTSDIINNYAFGPSESSLDRPDLNEEYFEAFREAGEGYHLACYLSFIPTLLKILPMPIVKLIFPKVFVFVDLMQRLQQRITSIRGEKENPEGGTTIFHRLIGGDLTASEKTDERMIDESRVLVAGGTDTTMRALSVITYHLLADPEKLQKLKSELEAALPDPDALPNCSQVETLPYLNAVIQEGLRLHPPVSLRQERVAPDEDLHYEDKQGNKYTIPKGTCVGMTANLLSRKADIYPSPLEFRPERFLENPRLDRYQLTFSRGTRRCIGINLAHQELQMVLAGIFRKYSLYDPTPGARQEGPTLELFETSRKRDVDMVADHVAAFIRGDSVGVRVLVR